MHNPRDSSDHFGRLSAFKWAFATHTEYEEIAYIKTHFEDVSFPLPG
jgi:hypothetical protein